MEMQNILMLIQAFTDHSLTELSVEDGGVKVCLKRDRGAAVSGVPISAVPTVGNVSEISAGAQMAMVAGAGAMPTVPVSGTAAGTGIVGNGVGTAEMTVVPAVGAASAAVPVAGVQTTAAVADAADIPSDNVVVSPLVGIFYSASSPEAEAFVKVGDRVKKGQVLGIIEAMKLMNEIESEYDGVVEAILVKNEEVVEYGQPLFRIR